MARKLRVYELARHYGVDSKAIMGLIRKMKAEAKSHMSVVEDDNVDKIHTVFQRKREIARVNYAKAHSMDPDKLKHVASLKPLPRPEPPPEPEKKPAKKKTAKKKKKASAKSKVVVIKKAGTKTAVARKQEAKREAEAKAAQDRRKVEKEAADKLAAKRAATRAEHARDREGKPVAKLVKKARPAVADQVPDSGDAETAVGVAEVDVAGAELVEAGAATPTDAAETVSAEVPAPATGAGETPPASDTAETPEATADAVAVVESPAASPDTDTAAAASAAAAKDSAAPAVAEAPPAKPGGPTHRIKKDGFKVGDIVRPAPPPPPPGEASRAPVSTESVKESIKAAIRKRQDERAAQEVAPRRKRTRAKRKKVDEAEVERQLKQTMAQLETGTGKRRRRKGGQNDVDIEEEVVVLRVTEFITVQELAEKLEVPAKDVITKLFGLGILATMNQRLEKQNIELLAEEFECEIEFLSDFGEEIFEDEEEVKPEDVRKRPPVVTVMGHVDHGKTSLLDRIRKTDVIAGEAGGITQHIGAYTVETSGGPITFLDTPGHAAFTAMRARGAQVTDIVILVVAANDGVMPQTVEAINHAKAAGVPLLVAVNKIDLADARADRVKQELMQHEIVIEEYGGDVLCAEISAKQGLNIERLLEQVHLQSEVLELTASPVGRAQGVVIEARKDPGRGVIFTVLIDKGSLAVGDIFLVGMQQGRVRALVNERGDKITEVLPGQPASVLGAHDVPEAGDRFHAMESERQAREIAGRRQMEQRQQQLTMPRKKIDLENLAEMMTTGDLKELPIIIKGDVAGSVEALADQLLELNTAEVQVNIMHKAVGAISESDVLLAESTDAMIIGFHLRPGAHIKDLAKSQHVTIEVFDIIYEAVDTLKKAMTGLLDSIQREVSTGTAEVRQVFRIPKLGQIAGSMVLDGKIVRSGRARLVWDEVVVFEGKIRSLRRFKEDSKEVLQGFECGIGLDNFYEIQEGDIIEAYEIEEVARTEF